MKEEHKKISGRASCRGGRCGFTLVELLAVIGIMLLLISMVFPGIVAVRKAAKRARARSEIGLMEGAVKAYMNDCGKLPIPETAQGQPEPEYWANDAKSKDVIRQLTEPSLNPRNIVYLEPQGNSSDGTYLDPWGTQYAMKFDADYNGIVGYDAGSGTPVSECIPAPVLVVSFGPNRKQEDPAEGDDIVSEAWRNRTAAGK